MQEVLSPERWQQLEALYRAALQVPQHERPAFLARVCDGDEELRCEAETLLDADDQMVDEFLQGGLVTLGMEVLGEERDRDNRTKGEVTTKPFETRFAERTVIDDRYEILSGLDAGGMGEVFKAKDLKFPDRPVVIKVLKEESKNHPWKFKKFRDEAVAQSRVQHPNVAMVFDKGVLPGGQPYLVVELIPGQNLGEVINAQKTEDEQMDRQFVSEIMGQICSGVSAIHRANLIHRDLKPKNIMVFETSETDEVPVRVKIIDFGIVRDLDKSTLFGQTVGTLPFMSPEQLSGDEVTIASDIYSLGVIAYQMLTNNLPFNARTHTQLHALQLEGVKVKPSDLCGGLPLAAENAILKALSYNPHDRQESARKFGDELRLALAAGKQTAALQPSPLPTTTPIPASSNRRWLIGAALLAVVLGVTLWGTLAFLKQRRPAATLSPNSPVDARAERQLTYWLTIVRQRDGKTIRATGGETFATGDEFRLNITPAQAGALYLFNEGTSGNWHVLFPTPENNQGNVGLIAQQTISTKDNRFTDQTGAEKGIERIWLVWATQPVSSLDDLVKESFKTRLTISDPAEVDVLRQFIAEHKSALPEIVPDKEQKSVVLKDRNQILVHLLELEHEDWK